MALEAWVWAASFIGGAVLLFIMIYFLISFSDLEHDHLNPVDFVARLNVVVLPEFALQGAMTLIFLLTGMWVALLLNLPLAGYHVKKYLDGKWKYDSTQVITGMARYMKECYVKLGVYLVFFFYYMYRMIYALVESVF